MKRKVAAGKGNANQGKGVIKVGKEPGTAVDVPRGRGSVRNRRLSLTARAQEVKERDV